MDRPLRFLMMTTFYPPYSFGGDGLFVQRLSNELARRGHSVDVIHCVDSYKVLARREPNARAEDHPNVTVHSIRSPMGLLSPLATQQTGYPFFKSARIREVISKGHDVIHYHNISLLGPKVLEYGEAIKLYTMHEYWLVCPMHVMFKFNREACAKPSCFACSLSYGRPPQLWRRTKLLEKAATHVDAFIAPSRFGKQLHEQMGLNRAIAHLPNFAPPVSSVIEEDVGNDGRPYFLFVGRLEKLKGLQTLIPVFRRYNKADLLIAGTGNYESELRQLAAGCDRIKFLGHRSEPQLQSLYRNAVALVMPSICFEMFPLVILEAFRQHRPVVARNIGGITEVIEESGGGLLYDSDEELAAALDRLLSDESYRQALGLRGHEAYLRNWTVKAHLKRYFDLIREVSIKKQGSIRANSDLPDGVGSRAYIQEESSSIEELSQNY